MSTAIRLTKAEKTRVKTYDDKVYVDWEGAFLNLCKTPEDIKEYKLLKTLAKKVYAKDEDNTTNTTSDYTS